MIDLLTIAVASVIIIGLTGFFGYLAWKLNTSDLFYENENKQQLEMINEKRRKDKNLNEQGKKKRKDQKKIKRETKEDEQQQQQQQQRTKSKGQITQTSEETDDEREESEQEILKLNQQTNEISTTKARKRNKNKTRSATPPPATTSSSSLLKLNKDEKHRNSIRAPPVTHPKSTTKNENETNKQQIQIQTKEFNSSTTKKSIEKQTFEQPFIVVGSNRNKTGPSISQQQNKSQINVTPVQHEQLTQRQTPIENNPLPLKQMKIAELVKTFPSSQIVVTELMSALDAFPLSTDELDLIMHKITNKQSILKKDSNKIFQNEKIDLKTNFHQITDETSKTFQHVKQLTDELNKEKLRFNDLLKEKQNKEREIEILRSELNLIQQEKNESNENKIQTLENQLKRMTEENFQLNKQFNSDDSSNLKFQVLTEQMKKLSVDNANFEKKLHSNDLLIKETQKEKENLFRCNEQLTKTIENNEKELKQKFNETNELKNRISQLQIENEQLKREEIVHVEPSKQNDEQRENYEKEIQQLKQTIDLNQQNLTEEIEKIRKNEENKQKQIAEFHQNELDRLKSKFQENLTNFLSQDVQNQLTNENQDFDQWFLTYKNLFESTKKNQQEEFEKLKQENVQLHKNMKEIENQLKDIEKTVQSKEEILLNELNDKNSSLKQIENENEKLRKEIERFQSTNVGSIGQSETLKNQVDERFLAAANSPQIVADESFELVKQSSPSLSPSYIDVRAEQLNELIRSSKEALENQDSVTQQLHKHLNEIQSAGSGETLNETSTSHQES